MSEVRIRPAMRYHGAKFRLAPWVISHFPAHTCYVEPFGGAAGVLLQKPRTYAEVYNDLDGEVVNFFRVLRDPVTRAELCEQLTLTPYARDEFDAAWIDCDEPVERARRLCIRAQMGFGSAGATKGSTGFRIDTRRKYGTSQYMWAEFPASVERTGERFVGVMIENRPAIQVMQAHDAPDTLFFVDPPYVLSTRKLQGSGRGYYRHEMTDDDHTELLNALQSLQGMVVVCGYETDLYREHLRGWLVDRKSAVISASRGSGNRTEHLWMNPACSAALAKERGQQRLIE